MADKDKDDKTTQDDLFSSIDPETLAPELKQVFKGFQADYTRKTQDLASKRKEFEEKEASFEDKLKEYGAVEQEVRQWRDWYASLEEDPNNADQTNQQQIPNDSQTPNYLDEPGSEEVKKYLESWTQDRSKENDELKALVKTLQNQLKDTTDQTSRMFSYHAQLNDLAGQYKDLDKQELLDYALKSGQMDLEKAYKDLHQEELIEDQVRKRVEEELIKQRTQGIRGPGQQIIVKPKEGAPKSFEEATQSVLNERAAKGL